MSPDLALAAAQTTPVRGDIAANLAQHLELAGLAAELGADVLVFPELSLTGYEPDLAAALAFAVEDARLAPLRAAAADTAMMLVAGAPVRLGERLYIGALILGADGSADVYTKHHLGAFPPSVSPDGVVPPAEATVFAPGDRNPLIRIGATTAAIAICADVSRAHHAQAAADRGARAFLASVFTIPAELDREHATLRGYATRHGMAVVCANFGGPTGGLPAAGVSAIWSERGELLARLGPHGAGVVVAARAGAGWRTETRTR